MTSHSGHRNNSPLEQLLDEIRFQRKKELRSQDPGFSCTRNTTYWTDLFVRHFLFQSDRSIDSDDLLFFVRKLGPNQGDLVEVWRRDSKKLPIGDPDIDWEETVCLNLVIHMFDYKITMAICTRTSPNNLQVIKRSSHRVWASPSHRRMDQTKSETEEMTYPFVCFSVDDHEEAWSDILVRDGEMVAVELVAVDSKNRLETVVWLGCVQYDGVRRVWETRTSQTVSQRLSQTNLLSIFGQTKERVEYVHVTGPGSIPGHSQLAVSKPRGHGCDTPSSEPGFTITDTLGLGGAQPGLADWELEDEMVSAEHLTAKMGFTKGHQRRCSDPSASIDTWLKGGVRSKPRTRHPSETDNMDKWLSTAMEITAGDLRDQLDDGTTNPVWTMRGYTQVLHNWKERKRADCIPLRVNLTYITLPWWTIIENIMTIKESPMLTF